MPFLTEEDGGKIKPSGYEQSYTPEQLSELIICEEDPIHFIKNYCFIQHPTRGRVKFELWPFQENLINVYYGNERVIAMLSRQCGKTTTAAAYILWSIFKTDQDVLVLSKDLDGAKEVMGRFWYAYEELPWWIKPGVKTNQVHTKIFDNNSRVRCLATTATSGRGKSPSLLYLDEFAFVRPGIAQEFWTAVYPSLSQGGRCIMTSTPNTDEDKFATIWFSANMSDLSDPWEDKMVSTRLPKGEEEDDDYETLWEDPMMAEQMGMAKLDDDEEDDDDKLGFVAYHAHWTSVPGRDERWKRKTMSEGITLDEWLREFECSFVSGDSTLISPMVLAGLRKFVKPPRFVDRWGCKWFEEIQPNMAYTVVLDPSEGIDLDDACIQVWEVPRLVQVAEWNSNQVDQIEQTKMLRRILKRLYMVQQNDPEHDGDVNIYYSVERNGLGIGILNAIELLDDASFPGWLVDSTQTSINVRGSGGGNEAVNRFRGLITSMSSKKRYATEFKSLVERGLFLPRSADLISQMKTFVKKGQSWAAKEGCKDDIVMGSILMCHLVEEVRYHEPDLDERVGVDLSGYHEDDPMNPDNMPFLPIV